MYTQSPKILHFFSGILLILCLVFLLTKGRPSLWNQKPTTTTVDSISTEKESDLILVDSILQIDSIIITTNGDSMTYQVDTTVLVDTFWNAATPPILSEETAAETTPTPPIRGILLGIALLFFIFYLLQQWLFKKQTQKYWLQYQVPLNNLYPDHSATVSSIPTTLVAADTITDIPTEEEEEITDSVPKKEPTTTEEQKEVVPTETIPTTNLFETSDTEAIVSTSASSNTFLEAVYFPIHLLIGIAKLLGGLVSFLLKKTSTLPSTDLGWKDIISVLFLLGFIPVWNIFIAPVDSLSLKILAATLLWFTPFFFRSDWKAAVVGIFLFVVELSAVGIYLLLQYQGDSTGRFPWEWLIGFVVILAGIYRWLSSSQGTSSTTEITSKEDTEANLSSPTTEIATPIILPEKEVVAPTEIVLKNPKNLPEWWKKIDLAGLLEIDMAGQQLTDDSPLIETYLIDALHLERLHFQANQLTIFPLELVLLEHLVYVDLSDNNIDNIPTDIKHNESIDMLIMNNNNITTIPNAVLARLRHLLHLELKGNPLDEYTLHQLKTTFPNTTVLIDEVEAIPTPSVDLELLEQKAYELLSEKLKNPTQVTFCMEFAGLEWSDIPTRPLDQLKNIEDLYLSSNELTTIPTVVFELKKLQLLQLYGNNITAIPKAITTLPALQSLRLNYNNIQQLPTHLKDCDQLKEISLSNCNFDTFPMPLTDMPQLQVIELENNKIKEIPKEIGKLTQLKILKLSGNPFTNIPKEIGQLQALEELQLSSIHLINTPKELFQLKKLKHLSIQFTGYSKLPAQIANFTALEYLNIGFSKDITLESDVFESKLPQLQKIHLSGMSLNNAALPNFSNLTKLTDIWISHNQLTQFPEQLTAIPTLKTISLDKNNIQSIPDSIGKLKNLEILFMSSNKRLSTLPKSLLELPKIRWITIRNTNISTATIKTYQNQYPNIKFEYD